MNCQVGRAALCAPRTQKERLLLEDVAHGMTRPTLDWFRVQSANFVWRILFPKVEHTSPRTGSVVTFRRSRSVSQFASCLRQGIKTWTGVAASTKACCGRGLPLV